MRCPNCNKFVGMENEAEEPQEKDAISITYQGEMSNEAAASEYEECC